ncbi:MAG TPA: hypothetical protein VE569_10260 [Acidimicrobiia bacterium]|nr:hypothetical protein [Acidimicrobiia bacterium]
MQRSHAYLNRLSIEAEGGSIPSEVQTALDDAAALLDEWDGSEAGKDPDIGGKVANDIVTSSCLWPGFSVPSTKVESVPTCDEDGSSA